MYDDNFNWRYLAVSSSVFSYILAICCYIHMVATVTSLLFCIIIITIDFKVCVKRHFWYFVKRVHSSSVFLLLCSPLVSLSWDLLRISAMFVMLSILLEQKRKLEITSLPKWVKLVRMLGAPVLTGTFMDLQKTTLSELIDILFIQHRFFNSIFIANELAINKLNT